MIRDVFTQTTIAIVWDFDKTLIPGYMQSPLFKYYKVDEKKFWAEVKGLVDFYKNRGLDIISKDTLYLNHIITYVRAGIFENLNNNLLFELGKKIKFYPGMPKFLETLKKLVHIPKYERFDINVEHYIISTGLRKMILGSIVSQHVDGVWGCEFVADIAPPDYLTDKKYEFALDIVSLEDVYEKSGKKRIEDIGYVIDNTTKTRAIFEINKGSNKESEIDVNAPIAEDDRRIPFRNMIYVADGPSDVPVFSVVKRFGGKTFAVYKPQDEAELEQVNNKLLQKGRIHAFGEADYEQGSLTHMWLKINVLQIADQIVKIKEEDLNRKVGKVPEHLS